MKNIMAGFDLKLHVDVTIHTAGHTFDLLFTKDPMDQLLKSNFVTDLSISDYYFVKCKLYTSPPPRLNKARLARSMTHFYRTMELLAHQLGKLLSYITEGSNVNDLLSDFDSRV